MKWLLPLIAVTPAFSEFTDCVNQVLTDEQCKNTALGIETCEQWVGNDRCDNGFSVSDMGYQIFLNCPDHDFDGGDCESLTDGVCKGVLVSNEQCDAIDTDSDFDDGDGNIVDCWNQELTDEDCAIAAMGYTKCIDWIGDGDCDGGQHLSDRKRFVNFNCERFGYDGGDCPLPVEPTNDPTPSPTDAPTPSPTPSPTGTPTTDPTGTPTPAPTMSPTPSPTMSPTARPTKEPTPMPTRYPTEAKTTQCMDYDWFESVHGDPTNKNSPDRPKPTGSACCHPMCSVCGKSGDGCESDPLGAEFCCKDKVKKLDECGTPPCKKKNGKCPCFELTCSIRSIKWAARRLYGFSSLPAEQYENGQGIRLQYEQRLKDEGDAFWDDIATPTYARALVDEGGFTPLDVMAIYTFAGCDSQVFVDVYFQAPPVVCMPDAGLSMTARGESRHCMNRNDLRPSSREPEIDVPVECAWGLPENEIKRYDTKNIFNCMEAIRDEMASDSDYTPRLLTWDVIKGSVNDPDYTGSIPWADSFCATFSSNEVMQKTYEESQESNGRMRVSYDVDKEYNSWECPDPYGSGNAFCDNTEANAVRGNLWNPRFDVVGITDSMCQCAVLCISRDIVYSLGQMLAWSWQEREGLCLCTWEAMRDVKANNSKSYILRQRKNMWTGMMNGNMITGEMVEEAISFAG